MRITQKLIIVQDFEYVSCMCKVKYSKVGISRFGAEFSERTTQMCQRTDFQIMPDILLMLFSSCSCFRSVVNDQPKNCFIRPSTFRKSCSW